MGWLVIIFFFDGGNGSDVQVFGKVCENMIVNVLSFLCGVCVLGIFYVDFQFVDLYCGQEGFFMIEYVFSVEGVGRKWVWVVGVWGVFFNIGCGYQEFFEGLYYRFKLNGIVFSWGVLGTVVWGSLGFLSVFREVMSMRYGMGKGMDGGVCLYFWGFINIYFYIY